MTPTTQPSRAEHVLQLAHKYAVAREWESPEATAIYAELRLYVQAWEAEKAEAVGIVMSRENSVDKYRVRWLKHPRDFVGMHIYAADEVRALSVIPGAKT